MLLQLMLVTLVMTDTGDASSDTTCIAVTDVFSTNVTCLFGRNMSKLNFNVKFFYPDRNAEPETALACNTKRFGGLVCHKGNGVVFDETQEINDYVTFTRPSSITVLRGEYLCQAIPHVGGSLDYCTLTYREIPQLAVQTPTPQPPEQEGSDPVVIVLIIIVLLLIIAVIIVCVILYIQRDRIRKWCLGALWPGAVGDPRENDPQSPRATTIPEGLPQYFYNLGWRDGAKDEGDPKPGDENAPRGRDTHHRQGPDREPDLTDTATQPLLLPAPGSVLPSATTSFTMEQKSSGSPQTAAPSTEDEDWCDVKAEHVEASIPLLTGGPGHSASSEEHGPGGESKQQRSDKGSKKGHENADKKAMKEKQEAEKKAKKEREEAEKKAKKEREEAEKKAKKEREEAEKKAKKEKDKAEKKAKDGEQKK
ncbi:uncharacterized protein LOC143291717 isoform X2 [Babylonia areolata]|uniref:uncharacterized protein LOC143291717 isoform X2 n=1 Tax=Babylonia areolata TaxID=304850 RepID=UPI003FD1A8A5